MAADIRSTKHNLTGRAGGEAKRMDERELCVFCHTPVIAVGEGGVPMKPHWQSSLPEGHSFAIYDDIGRLGLGKDSVGSQSIACLSCHDSSQAFGVTNSSADHPFGVPYRGSLQGRGGSFAGPDTLQASEVEADRYRRAARRLVAMEDFRVASSARIEDRTVWWVSRGGVTTRRTRSDLPLYVRNNEDAGMEIPHIECSSCHDPHTSNEVFLRVPNGGSKLCLTCHDK